MNVQRPLELILARNLLSSLSTPAFLVGEQGTLVYYNEAAGALLGRAFEETGMLSAPEWTRLFGPFDENGETLAYDEIAATVALRANRPYHGSFRIRRGDGKVQPIAASAIPIVGPSGSSGAIVIFWPLSEEEAVSQSEKEAQA